MKLGVFLCKCGPNISGKVNLDKVKEVISKVADVSEVIQEDFPCSVDGKKKVAGLIQKYGFTHSVFASCSHRTHEKTFMRIMEEAGLNPYLMEMANIREHCALVV